jgi:hypothetical protein
VSNQPAICDADKSSPHALVVEHAAELFTVEQHAASKLREELAIEVTHVSLGNQEAATAGAGRRRARGMYISV